MSNLRAGKLSEDYYLVVGMEQTFDENVDDVAGTAQVFIALASSEEEATAKIFALMPDVRVAFALVAPRFDSPPE